MIPGLPDQGEALIQLGVDDEGQPIITAYMIPDEGELGFTPLQVKEGFLMAMRDAGQDNEKQKILNSYFNGRGVHFESTRLKPSKQKKCKKYHQDSPMREHDRMAK